MRRDFRSRCLPMTDGREPDAVVALASLRDEPKVGTPAAKAGRFCGDYVVAEATTYKDFRTLCSTQALLRLRLIIPALQLRSTESYSLYECEPAR
jgi:hypothetical protein